MKPENMPFPVTLEVFTEYQESKLGRKINDTERKFFSDVVDMANQAFVAGAVCNLDTVADLLEVVDAVAERYKDCATLAAICRGWIVLGCRKGLEKLEIVGLLPS